jgi:hypothetical protein
MLDGAESSHSTGPAAGAGWLEDQTRNVLAAHTLISANGFYAFAATRTSEIQDVSEFAGTFTAGDTFHYRQTNVELWAVQYQ